MNSKNYGYVFYNPVRGSLTIASVWYWSEAGKGKELYQRTDITTDTWRAKTSSVLGPLHEALKNIRRNPWMVYLGRISDPNVYARGYCKVRLKRGEVAALQTLISKSKGKLREKGPVKVRDFEHYFSLPIKGAEPERLSVSSFKPLEEFLTENPPFKSLTHRSTYESQVWVPRKKYQTRMKVVKFAE